MQKNQNENTDQNEVEKKSIEIETPVISGKIDTGNKWLDFSIFVGIIVVLGVFAVLKFA